MLQLWLVLAILCVILRLCMVLSIVGRQASTIHCRQVFNCVADDPRCRKVLRPGFPFTSCDRAVACVRCALKLSKKRRSFQDA